MPEVSGRASMYLKMDSRLRGNDGHTKGGKEMISFLFSRRSALFIIVSLFCVSLYCNSHSYAEESLICADDIAKFCKEIKPGGGRILNCLKAHGAELTVPCRAKISELQGIIQDCEQACAGDIAQFCKDVQPGGGRIIKCLRERDKELSSSCKEKLEMISKRYQRKGE
jgi:Cysteine rich repeat